MVDGHDLVCGRDEAGVDGALDGLPHDRRPPAAPQLLLLLRCASFSLFNLIVEEGPIMNERKLSSPSTAFRIGSSLLRVYVTLHTQMNYAMQSVSIHSPC